MNVLKTGGSAVDAVEIAIKCLEDREITNAGYGSNLAMDGVVECDALIVDHNGRSGGAGAVARKSIRCYMCFSQLTSSRNQEPSLARPNSFGPLCHPAVSPSCTTQSTRWSRRHRLCTREWNAHRTVRLSGLTCCSRALEKMESRPHNCGTQRARGGSSTLRNIPSVIRDGTRSYSVGGITGETTQVPFGRHG